MCIYIVSIVQSLSHVWLFVTPGTIAHKAPQSIWFSRQEYWSGLPFSSPIYTYMCIYMRQYICVCVCIYIYMYERQPIMVLGFYMYRKNILIKKLIY